jgi:CRP-like cAMP-binding protein
MSITGTNVARLPAELPPFRTGARSSPRDNRVLASLPPAEFMRVSELLEPVRLRCGETLSEQATRVKQIHFPTTAILSMQHVLEDGATSEIAAIGREGVCGASALMDDSTTLSQVLVLSDGEAYVGSINRIATEFGRGGAFSRAMLKYVQLLFLQVTQTSMCNYRHSVEQRLCRWLLSTLDRLATDDLAITHERLGNLLGVRRESITAAAGRLQLLGAIRYSRGRLTVINRSKIDPLACGCYKVVKQLLDRLPLPDRERVIPKLSSAVPLGVSRYGADRTLGSAGVAVAN